MAKEEHFLGKVAQKAIIYRNDRVLLARDPRTPNFWELPGGRLNVGEDPRDGLRRELREELGVECQIEDVVFLKQFRQGNEKAQPSLVLVYTATLGKDAKLSLDPREIAEIGWFTKEEALSLPLFPEYLAALQRYFVAR